MNGRFLINDTFCILAVRKYNFRSKGRTNEIYPIFSLSSKEDGIFGTQGCDDHINVTLVAK